MKFVTNILKVNNTTLHIKTTRITNHSFESRYSQAHHFLL